MAACQSNVWEVSPVTRQVEKYGHPAVCPVEIPYRCMQAYTKRGERVLEPFGGSGTTLIAAEKAGRRAYLVEMSPMYCDVIVRRWEAVTGQKARKVAT